MVKIEKKHEWTSGEKMKRWKNSMERFKIVLHSGG